MLMSKFFDNILVRLDKDYFFEVKKEVIDDFDDLVEPAKIRNVRNFYKNTQPYDVLQRDDDKTEDKFISEIVIY